MNLVLPIVIAALIFGSAYKQMSGIKWIVLVVVITATIVYYNFKH